MYNYDKEEFLRESSQDTENSQYVDGSYQLDFLIQESLWFYQDWCELTAALHEPSRAPWQFELSRSNSLSCTLVMQSHQANIGHRLLVV